MQIAHDFADKALSKDKNKLAGLLDDKPTGGGQANAQVDATSMTAPSPHAADPVAAGKQRAFEKQLTPVIADGYNNLGAIAATESNYTGALKYFERAATWNPASEGLDYNMGRAAFMASKFSEAVPPLSRYVRLHPGDSGIRGALAMSQFMTHNYSGCLEALRGAGDSITSIPQMQYIYAESLVKTGQVAAGKARLLKLEAAHPEIAEVHRGLGEIAEHEGDRQNAIKELEEANGLNGSDPETHYDLGKADLESGSTADAILDSKRPFACSRMKQVFTGSWLARMSGPLECRTRKKSATLPSRFKLFERRIRTAEWPPGIKLRTNKQLKRGQWADSGASTRSLGRISSAGTIPRPSRTE